MKLRPITLEHAVDAKQNQHQRITSASLKLCGDMNGAHRNQQPTDPCRPPLNIDGLRGYLGPRTVQVSMPQAAPLSVAHRSQHWIDLPGADWG